MVIMKETLFLCVRHTVIYKSSKKKSELREPRGNCNPKTTIRKWGIFCKAPFPMLQTPLFRKEVIYLAYVHTCPASLRTWITKEPNFSYGKSHCQGVLEVSDLRLLHNLGNSNDSVGGSANLMSLFPIHLGS